MQTMTDMDMKVVMLLYTAINRFQTDLVLVSLLMHWLQHILHYGPMDEGYSIKIIKLHSCQSFGVKRWMSEMRNKGTWLQPMCCALTQRIESLILDKSELVIGW